MAAGRHEDVAGATVLALLAAGSARILVLAILAHVVGRATAREEKKILFNSGRREKAIFISLAGPFVLHLRHLSLFRPHSG